MLQRRLKHNFTLRRFTRVRMRLKHPVTLLTVSCFYRTHHGKNIFTNGETFFMSNYLNVSKQYFYHNFIPKLVTEMLETRGFYERLMGRTALT